VRDFIAIFFHYICNNFKLENIPDIGKKSSIIYPSKIQLERELPHGHILQNKKKETLHNLNEDIYTQGIRYAMEKFRSSDLGKIILIITNGKIWHFIDLEREILSVLEGDGETIKSKIGDEEFKVIKVFSLFKDTSEYVSLENPEDISKFIDKLYSCFTI
jgi:hypothetical protein